MARNLTGNHPVSGKPCDVEYRSRRLEVLIDKAHAVLSTIDPAAVHEGSVAEGLKLLETLSGIIKQISSSKPSKRTYAAAKPKEPKPEKPADAEPKKKKTKAPKQEESTSEPISKLDELLAAAE